MNRLNSLHFTKSLSRHESDHKGHSGKVLIIGGSSSMSGSIILAGLGALYSGAGWVKMIALDPAFPHLIPQYPELMIYSSQTLDPLDLLKRIKPDVIVIGPGLAQNDISKGWLLASIEYYAPLVIDADGLNLLASHPELTELIHERFWTTILTPHPGEASRLLNVPCEDIQKNRSNAIHQLIEMYNSIVILKGHKTLLGMKSEPIQTCFDGNPGMACAGMGDVLAGAIGSLVAQSLFHHLTPWQACCLAVEIHALAGDSCIGKGCGPIGMTPSELSKEIRFILNRALSNS